GRQCRGQPDRGHPQYRGRRRTRVALCQRHPDRARHGAGAVGLLQLTRRGASMANVQTATIVNLNTFVTQAPQPSQVQQSGALISTGGTTLTAGSSQYCGNLTALTAILQPAVALDSLTWASSVVTATTSATLGLSTGTTFTVV